MITLFERYYNEPKYAVIAIFSDVVHINVNTYFPNRVYKTDFKTIDNIKEYKVQQYTLEEAESYIDYLIRQYKQKSEVYKQQGEERYKFEAIPIEEVQILINAQKYNL